MKRRLRDVRRQRRRLILARLVASLGIGLGGIAHAWEPQEHASRRAHADKPIRVVADGGESWMAAMQAPQPPAGPRPAYPAPSGADAYFGDSFLDDGDGQGNLAAPLTDDEIGDVVNQAASPPVPPQSLPTGNLSGGLPTSLGVFAGSFSAAPQMMGDFFGGGMVFGSFVGATVALAGGDRRFKISENVSPAPQDRVYFNYNHFHNAVVDANEVSQSVDRFTFGMERSFLNGLASIETRLPFAGTVNSTQVVGALDTEATELGNIAFGLKMNLLSGRDWLLSGGTTLTIPTGDEYELFNGGVRQLLVENDAVHMAPFLGVLARPDQRWFAQGFLQADFDLNGNDVFTDANGFEGVFQDQNLFFVDASVGRWLRRVNDPRTRLSGLAAIAELHYTTTMNDTDNVAGVSNPFNRVSIMNATGALHFQFSRAALRVGAAAPVIDDDIRLYDTEILVQYNRAY